MSFVVFSCSKNLCVNEILTSGTSIALICGFAIT